jgi:hypothetical protein
MRTLAITYLWLLSVAACGGREETATGGSAQIDAAAGSSPGTGGMAGAPLQPSGGANGMAGGPSSEPCPAEPTTGAPCDEPVLCEHEGATCLCRDTAARGRIWMCGEAACPSQPPVADMPCQALAVCASGSKVCACDLTDPVAPRWSCGEGGCPSKDPTEFRGYWCDTGVGWCRFRLSAGVNAFCNCPVFDSPGSSYSCSFD